MPLVLVYGTLKAGGPNHRLMVGGTYRGERWLRGRIVSLGGFPAATLAAGDDRIVCELWEVTDAMMPALDRLEGIPRFYQREQTTTARGEEAWIYTMRPERLIGYPDVPKGRWDNGGT